MHKKKDFRVVRLASSGSIDIGPFIDYFNGLPDEDIHTRFGGNVRSCLKENILPKLFGYQPASKVSRVIYVALDSAGHICGTAIAIELRGGAWEIAFDTNAKNHGIGTALLERILRWANNKTSVLRLTAQCVSTNTPMVHLFLTHEFVVVERMGSEIFLERTIRERDESGSVVSQSFSLMALQREAFFEILEATTVMVPLFLALWTAPLRAFGRMCST